MAPHGSSHLLVGMAVAAVLAATGAALVGGGAERAPAVDTAAAATAEGPEGSLADGLAAADFGAFQIIERDDWGARYGRGRPMGQVDEVVVHHFKRPNVRPVLSPSGEARIMRRIERIHSDVNGWAGFGYSFVVFQSGRVYEGRGWQRTGAHTVGLNEDSIGIAFAIDGDLYEPTPEAWAAAEELVARGVSEGHLSPDLRISGHTDHADKSCPGERIQPRIQRLAPRS